MSNQKQRMAIAYVPIDSVLPADRNARKHPKEQLRRLVASIRRFGFRDPLLLDSAGKLIAGHARLEAARMAGLKEVPVIRADDLSDADARALAVALNRIPLGAEWDDAILREEIEASLDEGIDLEALGFGPDELAALRGPGHGGEGPDAPAQVDRAEELREQWKVEPGQLWALGDHRLLCGDSTKAADVARAKAGAEPALMVTDPPYGVEYDPAWRESAKAKGKVLNDDRVRWCSAYTLANVAVAYVWHASLFGADVLSDLDRAGLAVRSQIIWVKRRFPISRGHYHWAHEACWYAVREGAGGARWIGNRKQKTIWADVQDRFDPAADDALYAARVDEETVYAFDSKSTTVWTLKHDAGVDGGHGTQKPVECMARPIRNHDSEFVYEPFSGSGTTIIACERLGRKCRAIELSPGYVAVALQRYLDATGKEPGKVR